MEGLSFGEWVRQRRSALLLSREDLAEQFGCAVVTLRKIEADERRPSRQIAMKISPPLCRFNVAPTAVTGRSVSSRRMLAGFQNFSTKTMTTMQVRELRMSVSSGPM